MSKKKIPNITIKDIYLGKASFDGKTGEYLAHKLIEKIYGMKINISWLPTHDTMSLYKDGVTVSKIIYWLEKIDENGKTLKRYETFCLLEKELEEAIKEKKARDEMAKIARDVVEEYESKYQNILIYRDPEYKPKKKFWFF